ncbi:MAG: diacylglycerol kinase family protein [Sandaracinaceae bacterium]
MSERFVLVLNPRAGAGLAGRRRSRLERALTEAGADFETRLTARPRHATDLVREALREGAAGVAVVGGDGTLNEAVNGFFDEDGAVVSETAWLAPLPCGTGGDFRRTLGIPKSVEAMVTRMMRADVRAIDVGWLAFTDDDGASRERAFINIASFGLAGRVDRTVNAGPKWMGGTPAFLLGTFRAMIGFRPPRVRLLLDDAPERVASILNIAVANGRFFGGGMQVAPNAEIDDGSFDVVALEMDVLASLGLTSQIYRGAHIDRADVFSARARRVRAEPVDAGEHVLLDVDGEAPGRLPATFTIRPGAIRLRG